MNHAGGYELEVERFLLVSSVNRRLNESVYLFDCAVQLAILQRLLPNDWQDCGLRRYRGLLAETCSKVDFSHELISVQCFVFAPARLQASQHRRTAGPLLPAARVPDNNPRVDGGFEVGGIDPE